MAEAARKAVARPRKKSAAAKAAIKGTNPGSRTVNPNTNPWSGMLDPGDKVEIGATMELKDAQGRSYWPKASVTVTHRTGESEEQTVQRASQIAHEALAVHADTFLKD